MKLKSKGIADGILERAKVNGMLYVNDSLPNKDGLKLWEEWSKRDNEYADDWKSGRNPCADRWENGFSGGGDGTS